jgi:hypothetical protein
MNETEHEVVRWDTVVASYLLASISASFSRKYPSSEYTFVCDACEHLTAHTETLRAFLLGRGSDMSRCSYAERLSATLRELSDGRPVLLPPLPPPGMLVRDDVNVR